MTTRIELVQCADCFAWINRSASHTCKRQIKANKKQRHQAASESFDRAERIENETVTTTNEIDLYDEKGSCQICSTSTVRRRVDRAEFANHARRHRDVGDPVELHYSAGIRTGNQGPDLFKVITKHN